jgi:hypothetical protein
MSISPREKKLLGLCLVVAVISTVVLWSNLRQPAATAQSFSREMLNEEKRKFDDFKRVLKRRDEIEKGMDEIGNYLPSEKSAYEAEKILNFKIDSILRSHGIAAPKIQPSRQRSIPGVDEYRFLRFVTDFEVEYQKTCDLLDDFDRNGFFIESLIITTPALPASADNIRCTVKVTLSKLVELSADELDKVRKQNIQRGLTQNRVKV